MQSARGAVPSVCLLGGTAFITAHVAKTAGVRRRPQTNEKLLLRVELDDELLANRQRHVLTRRQLVDRAPEVLLVERDPLRDTTAIDRGERLVDAHDLLRGLFDLHDIARTHEVAGDVDLLAVDGEVTVTDELTRFRVVAREAHAVDDVVQTPFKKLDQGVTRDARRLE